MALVVLSADQGGLRLGAWGLRFGYCTTFSLIVLLEREPKVVKVAERMTKALSSLPSTSQNAALRSLVALEEKKSSPPRTFSPAARTHRETWRFRMLRVIAISMVLCALPMIAAAESASDSSRCDSESECTEYFMDDEEVEGGVQSPESGLIRTHRSFRRIPLIRARAHFVDLMLKSVENL
jgi:hypothetical protein